MADVTNETVETTITEEPKKEKPVKAVDPLKVAKRDLKEAQAKIAELELELEKEKSYAKSLKEKVDKYDVAISTMAAKYDKDVKFIASALNVFHRTVNMVLKED